MKRAVALTKHTLGILLNLLLLLGVVPTLTAGLHLWIRDGRPDFNPMHSLDGLNYTLAALVVWHTFVWEPRIKIRRQSILFLVRAAKAIWICSSGYVLIYSSVGQVPPRVVLVVISFAAGSAVYATLRGLFAPRHRI